MSAILGVRVKENFDRYPIAAVSLFSLGAMLSVSVVRDFFRSRNLSKEEKNKIFFQKKVLANSFMGVSALSLSALTLRGASVKTLHGSGIKILMIFFSVLFAGGALFKSAIVSLENYFYEKRVSDLTVRASVDGDLTKRRSLIVFDACKKVAQVVYFIMSYSIFYFVFNHRNGGEDREKALQKIALSSIIFFSHWFVGQVYDLDKIELDYL